MYGQGPDDSTQFIAFFIYNIRCLKKTPQFNCTPIVRQRNSNDWGVFLSKHAFETKLKDVDF